MWLWSLLSTIPTISMDFGYAALWTGPHYDSQHVFGFLALRNGTFKAIQSAFESWSNAECLDFEQTTNFTASAHFISLMLSSIKAGNTTTSSIKASGSLLPTKSYTQYKRNLLFSRADDSYAAIASRCGISGADFTKYNSAKGFYSKLKPDGLYAIATVGDSESCLTIGAANGLTEKDIDGFNQKT
ncbi:Peptidoglycan-binding Lysin subgroup [Penicillium samsonianum]|uniref:Peptidoglycan-binding Lysin subgroup n=1 Tax=Penicillium samsonianum TaxID=1882272 RepID=UPI0025499721|nr:Peptidoglycan-binding Lysin subgroup [Penicillium samsonianum]KAJ6127687.1 Peptidoglycan-binding Lysin subgroup [Penicillium samsonianum]